MHQGHIETRSLKCAWSLVDNSMRCDTIMYGVSLGGPYPFLMDVGKGVRFRRLFCASKSILVVMFLRFSDNGLHCLLYQHFR